MTVWNSLRSTFISTLRHPRLWLAQFFGNLAIALGFGLWLHIPDTHWWQLFFQFVLGLLVLVGLLLLHGGTLDYYLDLCRDEKAVLFPAFKRALNHLLAFAISVAIFCVLWHYMDKLEDYQYSFPGYLRSEFPAWLRRRISESTMDNLYEGFVSFLRWIVIPGLLLPLWLLCVDLGFRGFSQLRVWGNSLRNLSYWIVLIVAALIGVYCTGKLMDWKLHPGGPAVTKEGIWLGFRLFLAYLLGLFSWFWVCAMLARATHKPPAKSQKAAA